MIKCLDCDSGISIIAENKYIYIVRCNKCMKCKSIDKELFNYVKNKRDIVIKFFE